ncbi:MAG: hypothetical protein PHX78_06280 [bacterium]|nr:hypothetical protein [bacterium]
MKKCFTALFIILIINILTPYVYSDSLRFVPSESLGYLRISDVEKTIGSVDKLAYEIDSTYNQKEQSVSSLIGGLIDVKAKNKEELQNETGIKINGDLILFWPGFNWKNKAYAYQIINKDKTLESLKNKKGNLIEPIPIHEGIEIYIFSQSKQECYFFIDDYLVNCGDETTARLIINCYKGKSNSITANPKYSNLNKSIRDYEIVMYVNAELLVNMFLPTIQLFGDMYTQKAISSPNVGQNPQNQKMDPQQLQNLSRSYLKLVTWMLEQLESAGFSAHLHEKGIVIDSYLGFKKESLIQNYLVQKNIKLRHMEYINDNCIFATDTKSNPETLPDIYSRILENVDTTILALDSTEITKFKESLLENLKWQASYLGNEESIAIFPSSGKFPINILWVREVTNMPEASNIQKQLSMENPKMLFRAFGQNNPFSNPEHPSEIKEVIDYNGVNITSFKTNINLPEIEKTFSWLNDLISWQAVTKNKQIFCFSESDDLIKQTIDSLNNGTRSPLVKSPKYQAAIMNLPEDTDSISYLSIISIIKTINGFSKSNKQKSCFDIIKNIENAAGSYYNEMKKYPQNLDELFANENTIPLIKKRPRDSYSIDSTSGKVTCETHGSLDSPVPLEKIKNRFGEMPASEGNIGSIGFSSKNQNNGISENINIPVETIKSIVKIIKPDVSKK